MAKQGEKDVTNATLEDPKLQEADSDFDDLGEGDDGDANGYLVTFLTGGYEVVELEGTADAGLTFDEVMERFDEAERKGKGFFVLGRRRLRMSDIRSFGPEAEVDYPEVSVFGMIEDRTERLLKGVDHCVSALTQSAQATQFLSDQQAALSQAQLQLFESIQAEQILAEDDEEPSKSSKTKKRGGGNLKPMRRRS